ncbi:ribonuclease H-like protein [Xylaria sp. CBS 124048]|nr:ribonuclease H-like protein [Xylaria sp. CBS 124048]
MTATPSRQLWHPSRGISFAPAGLAPLASPARAALPPAELPARTVHCRRISSSPPLGALGTTWSNWSNWSKDTPPIPTVPAGEYVSSERVAGETALGLTPGPEPVEEPEEDEQVEVLPKKVTNDPPPPVLEYKMIDDMFYAAKAAPPGSPESFWSYTQYVRKAADGEVIKPTVHYCRSKQTMERVCQYFIDEKVLGFDMEWVADSSRHDGVRKNVSLIQLASPSRIALFHVALFPQDDDLVSQTFRTLMQDPDIMKVGVNIKGDATRLRKFVNIESRGLVELSHLYRLVTYCRSGEHHKINRKLVPLAIQVQDYLHLPLFKGQDVRSSNWSSPLNMNQVKYSASDAYAGLQLYATLEHHRKQLDPCPPHPHYAELNMAIRLAKKADVVPEASVVDEANVVDEADMPIDEDMMGIEREEVTVVNKRTRVRATTKRTPVARPQDSRVEIAEDKANAYLLANPGTRLTLAKLRAYYLFHHYDLQVTTIAELLRDPPLKQVTVANYILAAVQSGHLPVDPVRLRQVTELMPEGILWVRFRVSAAMVARTRPKAEE